MGLGEPTVDRDSFLDRGQGLLPPPHVIQAAGLVAQRQGEAGEERVGAGLGELAADRDGFLDRGQGLLPPPQVAQAVAEIYQPSGTLAIVGGIVSQSLKYDSSRCSEREGRIWADRSGARKRLVGNRLARKDLCRLP